MKKSIRSILLPLISIFFITSCLGDGNTTDSTPDQALLAKAGSYDQLSTFSQKADSVELGSLISDTEAYTLFAPTNDAFSQLDDNVLDTLSVDQLQEVLSYHLADTALFTSNFGAGGRLETLQGEEIFIATGSNSIFVNSGQLVAANIQATNGVLHGTNNVLFPDSYLDVTGVIDKRTSLNGMDSALEQAELKSTLSQDTNSGYTVFAPSNSAFQGFSPDSVAALQDTMEYHIIPQAMQSGDFQNSPTLETLNGQQLTVESQGDSLTVNGNATVTTTDLAGANGVVHIIDQILYPPEE